MIKKILFSLMLIILWNAYGFAQDYWIAYEDLEIILDKTWTVKIWCYLNWKAYTWKNDKWEVSCKGKNISIPPKKHLQYFKKYFVEKDWKLFCDKACLNKIANRWALVNFESSFNPNAISKTSDYGYIQVHGGKDFLWEHKIQTSLDWLDNRWQDHWINLCAKKYHISDWDSDAMFKCLMMRHNGQKKLNNHYSLRGLSAKNFYLSWLNEQIDLTNKWHIENQKLLAQIDKKQEKIKVKIEKQKEKIQKQENEKFALAQGKLLLKLEKIQNWNNIDLTWQLDFFVEDVWATLWDWKLAFLEKNTEIGSILSTP